MEAIATDYAFLDAGAGRRLERFGPIVLDRPAPAADGARREPAAHWSGATARFERTAGAGAAWLPPGALPPAWTITIADLALELRPTPAGQVGVFPEHLGVAAWAAEQARALEAFLGRPAVVLNLFAYTGLATLLLAHAGAEVAHVDASRPAVAWARRNAALSSLGERPIRWLVEDASRFAVREARRGRRYDGIVLDPPTYGHGTGGAAWRLDADLAPLLDTIRALLGAGPWFLACTAHATGLEPGRLHAVVRDVLRPAEGSSEARSLELRSAAGARLDAGAAVLVAHVPGSSP